MLVELTRLFHKKDIDLAVSEAAKDNPWRRLHWGYGCSSLRRVVEQLESVTKSQTSHRTNLDAQHLEADMEDGVLVIKEKMLIKSIIKPPRSYLWSRVLTSLLSFYKFLDFRVLGTSDSLEFHSRGLVSNLPVKTIVLLSLCSRESCIVYSCDFYIYS